MPVRASRDPETVLYPFVKAFLEARGFEVKGEIVGCDIVAVRGDEPPVIVIGELKLTFNLGRPARGPGSSPARDG